MMKKFFLYIVLAILAVSCYKDLSTEAGYVYPQIVITSDAPSDTINCAFGDILTLKAEAHQEGIADEYLSYMWEMDVVADRYSSRALVSQTNEVEMKINQTSSNTPYILALTVTNTQSGYSQTKSWTVFVTSALGEGLLVGHTRDGGQTSEIDLIRSSSVTYNYSALEPKITRDAFRILNDEPLEGRILAMEAATGSNLSLVPMSSYNENTILIGTDKHFYTLDPTNYGILRMDSESFTGYSADKYIVSYIKNSGAVACQLIVNGLLCNCGCILDNTFSRVSSPMVEKASFTGDNFCAVTENQGGVAAFDNVSKKFYGCQAWMLYSSSLSEITGSKAPTSSFIADKTSVAAGEFNGGDNIFIMKGKANDYHAVLTNNGLNKDAMTYELSAENIDKAVSFAFCDNANVFFYVTPTKVYSSLLSSGQFNTKALSWSPDSKQEKITHIYHYKQGWYGTHQYDIYDFTLKSNHRLQMIITTYNESTGEGKVYIKPFNVSTGMFSAFKDGGTFGGFGEITSVTETMR